MSVINEALKKIGQPILVDVHKRKKSPANWGAFFVVAVLLIMTAPILFPLLQGFGNNTAGTANAGPDVASSEDKVVGSNMKAQFAVEEAPIAQTFQPVNAAGRMPAFNLSGIVYSEGGSFCLINRKVLKVGDTVGGATLVKVMSDQVVLNYHGKEIVVQPTN